MAEVALPTKDPEARRALILQATIDMIRERGVAGTRMADIAERAGTSPALVAYHFKSLTGVLAGAITAAEEAFYRDLEADLGGMTDARAQLRYCIELATQASPAIGDWVLWMELWVQALRDPQARRTREQLDRRWRLVLTGIIERGCRDGEFRCADPAAAALRLASLMDGLAVQVALSDSDVDQHRMVQLWLHSAAQELGIAVSRLRTVRSRTRRTREDA